MKTLAIQPHEIVSVREWVEPPSAYLATENELTALCVDLRRQRSELFRVNLEMIVRDQCSERKADTRRSSRRTEPIESKSPNIRLLLYSQQIGWGARGHIEEGPS